MSESTECKKARTSSLRLFTRSNNNLTKSIKHDDAAEIVERKFEELSQKYSNVQKKDEEYISSIEDHTDFNVNMMNGWMMWMKHFLKLKECHMIISR